MRKSNEIFTDLSDGIVLRGVEQVYDFLVVELEELRGDLELGGSLAHLVRLRRQPLDAVKKVVDAPRDDAHHLRLNVHVEPGTHRVRLARPGLKQAQETHSVSFSYTHADNYTGWFESPSSA